MDVKKQLESLLADMERAKGFEKWAKRLNAIISGWDAGKPTSKGGTGSDYDDDGDDDSGGLDSGSNPHDPPPPPQAHL